MRFAFLCMTVFMATAAAAQADDRFICSGDDPDVRFTIDVGFVSNPGIHLNHFRGALAVKKRGVSAGFGKRLFGSDKLLQSWWHGKTLRLEVLDEGGRETDRQSFNLVLAANGSDGATDFSGTYKLTITGAAEQPLAFDGKVTCGKRD